MLFFIYSYLPVIDPSSPAGGEGYFSQQFQHSTPTTPLKSHRENSKLKTSAISGIISNERSTVKPPLSDFTLATLL